MDTRVFKLSTKNPIISLLGLPLQAAVVINLASIEQGNPNILRQVIKQTL